MFSAFPSSEAVLLNIRLGPVRPTFDLPVQVAVMGPDFEFQQPAPTPECSSLQTVGFENRASCDLSGRSAERGLSIVRFKAGAGASRADASGDVAESQFH
jgi:hypothetical protein